jgi:hypothetical protein
MGNKKKISKFFRTEAAKLAPETYEAYHKYPTIQYHMDGEQAIPVFGEMELCKVNHARRLRKLYKKHGKEAVDKYFNDRGFKLVPKEAQKEVTEENLQFLADQAQELNLGYEGENNKTDGIGKPGGLPNSESPLPTPVQTSNKAKEI